MSFKFQFIKGILTCIVFLFLIFETQGQCNPSEKLSEIEIPMLKCNENIIHYTGFSLSYNETYEQANWVAYELRAEETTSTIKRTNQFKPDTNIKTGSATHADYSKSGFDRGHLAPAGDMGWSVESMYDCFYYSNISPQLPGFNRGIWKKAEELTRRWARDYKRIYIVTGPVFTEDMPTIGPHKVAVPSYFYKVILDFDNLKGLGFIIPNASSLAALQNYVVTIDSVEKLTNIDFFPLLPDDQEEKIESLIHLNDWNWMSSISNSKFTNTSINNQYNRK